MSRRSSRRPDRHYREATDAADSVSPRTGENMPGALVVQDGERTRGFQKTRQNRCLHWPNCVGRTIASPRPASSPSRGPDSPGGWSRGRPKPFPVHARPTGVAQMPDFMQSWGWIVGMLVAVIGLIVLLIYLRK